MMRTTQSLIAVMILASPVAAEEMGSNGEDLCRCPSPARPAFGEYRVLENESTVTFDYRPRMNMGVDTGSGADVLIRWAAAGPDFAYAKTKTSVNDDWEWGQSAAGGTADAEFRAEKRWGWVPEDRISKTPGVIVHGSYTITGFYEVDVNVGADTGPADDLAYAGGAAICSALFELSCCEKEVVNKGLVATTQNSTHSAAQVEGELNLGASESGEPSVGVGGMLGIERSHGFLSGGYRRKLPVNGGIIQFATSSSRVALLRSGNVSATAKVNSNGNWANAMAEARVGVTFNNPVFELCSTPDQGPLGPTPDPNF